MSVPPNRSKNSANKMILWLVWASLFFSLLIIALVSLLIPAPPNFVPSAIASGIFPPILVIFILATLALIPVLQNSRKKMFFDSASSFETKEKADNAYFTMAMTTWVFCELVGVFGLIMAYLTFEILFSLPFVLVGAVLLAVYRPQPKRVDAAHPRD